MEIRKLRQLFRQYLLGHAPEKESRAIDQWYSSFDKDPPQTLSEEEEHNLRQEMWAAIRPATAPKRFNMITVKAAAVAVLLGGTGLTFFLLQHTPVKQPAYADVFTKAGEKKTLHLKDGSTLIINAGSHISFPQERQVNIIDGEVFFDVKEDPRLPFIVESGPVTTTVLGTSFNVTAYEAMHHLSIGVVSGKVSVQRGDSANVLGKDEALVYNKTTHTSIISTLDQGTLGWQEGKLLLNDVSFDEMVIMMQKNFGVNIIASQQSVRTTRYTTELSTVMEPLKATQVLAAIHQLKVKVVNHQILIYE